MDVYFDVSGIERTLGLFTKEQLIPLTVATNWKSRVDGYDKEVKQSLMQLWRRRGTRDSRTLLIQAVILFTPGEKQYLERKKSPPSRITLLRVRDT